MYLFKNAAALQKLRSEQISFVPKSVHIEDAKDLVGRLSREKEMTQTDECRKLIKEYIAGWEHHHKVADKRESTS